jgi:chemotaxis protein CheD
MSLPSLSKHASPVLADLPSVGGHDPVSSNPHFLHAGQIYVSAQAESIVLILGSCVAVCIWDPVNGIGGATHYLLPSWDGKGVPSPRYGNVAVSALLQKLADAGANGANLQAKVFGGGCLFDVMREASPKKDHLGSRNVEIAVQLLGKERIPIVSTAVGGDRGQRIVFHTGTGQALVTAL